MDTAFYVVCTIREISRHIMCLLSKNIGGKSKQYKDRKSATVSQFTDFNLHPYHQTKTLSKSPLVLFIHP